MIGSQTLASAAAFAVTSAALKGGSAVGGIPSSLLFCSAAHTFALSHSAATLSFCSFSMWAYSSSPEETNAVNFASAASRALNASGRSSASRSRATMFAVSAFSSSSFAMYTAFVTSMPSSYNQSSVAISLADTLLCSSSDANLLYLVLNWSRIAYTKLSSSFMASDVS